MSSAAEVVARLVAAGQTVAVAESLTGGLVTAALTAVPGASAVVAGGITAYQTPLKARLLDVPEQVLATEGAVSAATAVAMAAGVRARLGTDWGVATTGVAGPEPQEGKAVGRVHVAVAGPDLADRSPRVAQRELVLPGDRGMVRAGAVDAALLLLLAVLPGVA